MKTSPFASSAAALAAFALAPADSASGQAPATPRQPNVVVVYTDDQGWADMGCYGATDLWTPHSDALAERGIRFTQMYAPSPVSSPSRASLLTGRYPDRTGLVGNAPSIPGEPGGMPAESVTLADTFRAAGYATAHIGKWHLGYTPDTMPNAQGFDHSFGHMGGCIDNYSHFFYWSGPNRHDLWRNGVEVFHDGEYFPDLMVEEARRFIGEHAAAPFLIYFAMNTPHYPYQPDESWLRRYREAGVPYPRDLYGAFVSTQDERIGRLVAILEEHGLLDDTIIVLQADHGHSTEERAHFGGGDAGPFRGAKFSLFEGGIRVPSIVSWPAGLPAGAVRDAMVHGCDWLPTLAALCGVPLLEEDLDGRDISAVLRGESDESPHQSLRWTFQQQRAARKGPWKLIANPLIEHEEMPPADRKWFLANLDDDPGETRNLAAEHPEIVEELRRLLP